MIPWYIYHDRLLVLSQIITHVVCAPPSDWHVLSEVVWSEVAISLVDPQFTLTNGGVVEMANYSTTFGNGRLNTRMRGEHNR